MAVYMNNIFNKIDVSFISYYVVAFLYKLNHILEIIINYYQPFWKKI